MQSAGIVEALDLLEQKQSGLFVGGLAFVAVDLPPRRSLVHYERPWG